MQNPNIFKGITPMVYCYFNRNKTIDKILMKEQINIISKMKISGIAALGLGTEVNKLSFNEKKLIIELLALESKNKPFAITIQGNSLKEYFELIKVAISNQVKWIIIQPLIKKGTSDKDCLSFFKKIIPKCNSTLVGIQNAKEYLGVGLNPNQIKQLYNEFTNFRAIKSEASAIHIRKELIKYPNDLLVFNGRGGQEIIENLQAGCSGIVPTPECSNALSKIYYYVQNKKIDLAYKEYQKILPGIVFIMQSIDALTFYGKRIFAKKMGINIVYDRNTNLEYSSFEKNIVEKIASRINII